MKGKEGIKVYNERMEEEGRINRKGRNEEQMKMKWKEETGRKSEVGRK